MHREQKVTVADITCVCLNALIDELLCIKLADKQVDAMLTIDLSCKGFVIKENSRKALCLKLVKALWSYVQSVLLRCNLYSKTLLELSLSSTYATFALKMQ